MTRLAAFFLASALASVAAGRDTVDTLMRLDEQFCLDSQAKGVDGWMSYFADDLVAFRPDGPIMHTKAEAEEHYRKAFGPGKFELSWKPLGGMISSGGDLGFTYGTYQSGSRTGKYMTTWKKQKDGRWKIVADIGNPDAPAKK